MVYGGLLQTGVACCTDWQATREGGSKLSHWATRNHRECGAVGERCRLGVVERWARAGGAGGLMVLSASLSST